MRKPKIYLETTIISHLCHNDVPDKMKDTLALWKEIKQGRYNVYISETTIAEIMATNESKRSTLLDYMSEINYSILNIDEDTEAYARKLNSEGILSSKHFDDCLHIGCAVVNGCTMIVSWNFRHIVKAKTINGVRYISSILGYTDIGIYSPSMIIQEDD